MSDATTQVLADAQRVLHEVGQRPRAYRYLRLLLADDADRTIAALDQLIAQGRIQSRIINRDTHYEAVRR